MENSGCMVARALKPSLRRELSMKPFNTQQLFPDEFSNSLNAQNVAVSVEDYFSVDCFLDLPVGHEEEEEDEEKDSLSISSQEDAHSNVSASSAFLLSTHLAVPDEELAELEWVSQFVDDSSSEFSLLYPAAAASKETSFVRFEPEAESRALIMTSTISRRVPFLFPYQLPGKPRTKRSRPTRLSQTWSPGPPLTQSSSSSSLTPTSSSVSTPFILSDYTNMVEILDPVNEPAVKKSKREPPVRGEAILTQFQRRCSHCLVQKTPQWRAGPLGPKTLCNACGVRYKSGRLFPEYRPACSPTFSGDIHSNSHRKVLEMRRRKEMAQPVSGLSQMVPGF